MNGAQHGAGSDDSKGRPSAPAVRTALPGAPALRAALAVLGLAGALALVVATFATIIRITVGSTARLPPSAGTDSGWDRHGPALIVLALLGLWLLATGLRGARIALAGLAVVGVAAMAIAFASDRGDVHKTGSVGDIYATARANPGTGYYLETLGGVLLLVAGGGLLLVGRPAAPERDRDRRRRAERAGSEAAG